MKPYGLCADIHLHSWSAFSKVSTSGVNERLEIILSELKRCSVEVIKAGGDTMIVAGDIFHVRGSIAPLVLNPTMDCFREIISSGVNVTLLAGNHDAELKDVTRLSSAITALEGVGCSVINEYVMSDDMILIPWQKSVAELKLKLESITGHRGSRDLILHAPIDDVLIGIPSHGLDASYLASLGFRRVFSGHYHNFKDFENKVYSIGSTTHLTWSDIDSKAGFLIVSDEGVKWHKSHAPEFVEIDAGMDHSEIAMIVDGHYVRAKLKTSKQSDVEESRQFLLDSGAKGVVIVAEREAVGAMRTGTATVKAGASLEVSVGDFIKAQSYTNQEALALLCHEILTEARGA